MGNTTKETSFVGKRSSVLVEMPIIHIYVEVLRKKWDIQVQEKGLGQTQNFGNHQIQNDMGSKEAGGISKSKRSVV